MLCSKSCCAMQNTLARTGERWKISSSHRILRIEGSAEHSRCTCLDIYIYLHALIMNNFEHRVLRIEPINIILLYKGLL